MKRIATVLCLFALLGGAAVYAQAGKAAGLEPAQAAQVAGDMKFLTLELGLPLGYRLSDGALVSGRAFALGVAVADNFTVGISTTQIGTTAPLTAYNALRLSYTIMPLLGTSLSIGQAGANASAGIGFYSTLLQTKNSAGLNTGLRLKIDYLFDTTAMSGGSIVFSTAILFGI